MTFNKKALAKSYAAKFLLNNDALWVAEEMYSIMEESLQYDQTDKQELTKDFLTDIIEIMNKFERLEIISYIGIGFTLAYIINTILLTFT